MKALKQILNKFNLVSIFKFKVQSKSNKEKFHIVKVFKDQEMKCDCQGYWIAKKYGHYCSHCKIVKRYLKRSGKLTIN